MSKTSIIPQGSQLILGAASKAIANHIAAIEARMEALHQDILPDQLKIGLHCLKAHCVFAIKDPHRNKSGKNQHSKTGHVHVDVTSQGFEGWLAANHPKLKKPTAYRWMTALKGLDLNESASEQDIEAALSKHVPAPSLKSLCAAALDAIGPPAPPPPLQQTEFEFLRQGLTAFREEAEHIVAMMPQLQQNPDMLRAATARAYQVLRELTGTEWTPSDEPDALSSVDPNAITI